MLKKINGQTTRLLYYTKNNFMSFIFKLSVFSTMLILIYLVADSAKPSREYPEIQPIESSQKLMLTIPTDVSAEITELTINVMPTEAPTTIENFIPKVEETTVEDFGHIQSPTTETYVITRPFFPIQKQATTPTAMDQTTDQSGMDTIIQSEVSLADAQSNEANTNAAEVQYEHASGVFESPAEIQYDHTSAVFPSPADIQHDQAHASFRSPAETQYNHPLEGFDSPAEIHYDHTPAVIEPPAEIHYDHTSAVVESPAETQYDTQAPASFESPNESVNTPRHPEDLSFQPSYAPEVTDNEKPTHETEFMSKFDGSSQESQVGHVGDEKFTQEDAIPTTYETPIDLEPSHDIQENFEDKVAHQLEASHVIHFPHETEEVSPLQSLNEEPTLTLTTETNALESHQDLERHPDEDAITMIPLKALPEHHSIVPQYDSIPSHYDSHDIGLIHEAETAIPYQLLHDTTTDMRELPKIPSAVQIKRSLSLNELEYFKETTERTEHTTPSLAEQLQILSTPTPSTTTSESSTDVANTTTHSPPTTSTSDDLFRDEWSPYESSENDNTQISPPEETTSQSPTNDVTTTTEKSFFDLDDEEFSAMEVPTVGNDIKDTSESHEEAPCHEVFKDENSAEDKHSIYDTSPILSPNNLLNLFNFDHLPAPSNIRPTRWSKSKNAAVPMNDAQSASSQRHTNTIHSHGDLDDSYSAPRMFNRFHRFQNLDSLLNLRLKDSMTLLERLFGDLLQE